MTPSDPATPRPGALSARLLEACEDLSAWWLAPLRAGRGAAEALGRGPAGFAPWDRAWNGFQKPFLAASAHVEALRDPAPMLSAPLAQSVMAAENAGSGQTAGDTSTAARAIGSARNGSGVFPPSPGLSDSRASARKPYGAKTETTGKTPPSHTLPAPSSSGRALARASAAPSGASPHRVNGMDADMGPWLARARKAITRWAPSPSVAMAKAANPGAAIVPAPQAAGADSPDAQTWFSAWVKGAALADLARPTSATETASPASGLAGGTGASGASGVFAPALSFPRSVPAASARTAPLAPSPRAPAWTDILDELMPRPSPGSKATRTAIADPAPAFDALPTGSPGLKDRTGIPNGITSGIRPGDDTSRPFASGPSETRRPQGAPSVEWLDEEEDLAGKLHRLLRRQAKRRGVDLS